MRYIFKIQSAEQSDFEFCVQIGAGATFLELHNAIVEACKYDASQMASFFTLDAKGQRLQEIGLMELSSEGSEMNVAVMDVATLSEFIGDEVKVLEYQYDFFGDRYFTLQVEDLQEGEQAQAVVFGMQGTAPEQIALEGFDGLDFSASSEKAGEMDYEKYLASFDDCSEEDLNYDSLDDLGDEFN